MTHRRDRQRGFSLLEILVAFSIMGLSLGMLYRATGSSARSVGDAGQYQQAMLLAQSLLAVRDSVPEGGWAESGQSGAYHWRIQSAPYPTPTSQSQPTAVALHEVVFHIDWAEGERQRQVELVTLLPQHVGSAMPGVRR